MRRLALLSFVLLVGLLFTLSVPTAMAQSCDSNETWDTVLETCVHDDDKAALRDLNERLRRERQLVYTQNIGWKVIALTAGDYSCQEVHTLNLRLIKNLPKDRATDVEIEYVWTLGRESYFMTVNPWIERIEDATGYDATFFNGPTCSSTPPIDVYIKWEGVDGKQEILRAEMYRAYAELTPAQDQAFRTSRLLYGIYTEDEFRRRTLSLTGSQQALLAVEGLFVVVRQFFGENYYYTNTALVIDGILPCGWSIECGSALEVDTLRLNVFGSEAEYNNEVAEYGNAIDWGIEAPDGGSNVQIVFVRAERTGARAGQ